VLPKPLNNNLRPVTPGTVVLEASHVIEERKKAGMVDRCGPSASSPQRRTLVLCFNGFILQPLAPYVAPIDMC